MLQRPADGAVPVDGPADDGDHPVAFGRAPAGQVDDEFLVQRRVPLVRSEFGPATCTVTGTSSPSRRASEWSALIPAQPASAIFSSSPGVKTSPAATGPIRTCAPRALWPV